MYKFIPVSYDDICRRWHEATVSNNMLKWHAIHAWLISEALFCASEDMDDAADTMTTAANLARQHALDLEPQPELEAA